MKRFLAISLIVLSASCGSSQPRVVIAAGTTLVDSGILDALARNYEVAHNVNLSIVGDSTQRVLELGRVGSADVLITHSPDLEKGFLDEGLASRYEPVLRSQFILVGPAEVATSLAGRTFGEAFRAVTEAELLFASRGDGSGTNMAERAVWDSVGLDPTEEDWYLVTGQGMGATLQVADQRRAIILSELGAFLAAQGALDLEPIALTEILDNPYHAIVVADSEVGIESDQFIDWLVSEEAGRIVMELNLELFGEAVYLPEG